MTKYCKIEDVQRALQTTFNNTTTPTTADVEVFIEDASADLDDQTGRSWGENTEYQEHFEGEWMGRRQGTLYLKNKPVIKVHKLEYWDSNQWKGDTQEGPPGSSTTNFTYTVHKEDGRIVLHSLMMYGPDSYRVTYTWGYESPPRTVVRVTSEIAALKALMSLSANAQMSFNIFGVAIRYAGGWEFGQQAKMIQEDVNKGLSRLREYYIERG